MPLTPTTTHALLAHDLKRVFGYDTFRPLQREIMEASLSGHDVLAILPTGAGKSLCYQLPALARSGLTVVASPLIALMKDQVDQMKAAGVAATFLNSTLDGAQLRKRETKLDNGEYRILYVAPERLVNRDFLAQLRGWNVEAFAVDEAHCISEWGHDFRPEYRQIATARDAFPNAPIIALTATATERVRDDIVRQLRLRDPQVFLASFDRPNLMYRVEPKASGKDGTAKQIIEIAARMPSDSGIVYCQSRKATELLTEALTRAGHTTVAYHAGLDAKDRARNQEAFLRDEVRIVCAPIAFGMGINKPNVRFVAHADLRRVARAAMDCLPSACCSTRAAMSRNICIFLRKSPIKTLEMSRANNSKASSDLRRAQRVGARNCLATSVKPTPRRRRTPRVPHAARATIASRHARSKMSRLTRRN